MEGSPCLQTKAEQERILDIHVSSSGAWLVCKHDFRGPSREGTRPEVPPPHPHRRQLVCPRQSFGARLDNHPIPSRPKQIHLLLSPRLKAMTSWIQPLLRQDELAQRDVPGRPARDFQGPNDCAASTILTTGTLQRNDAETFSETGAGVVNMAHDVGRSPLDGHLSQVKAPSEPAGLENRFTRPVTGGGASSSQLA
jgi:hypothetical protein